MDDLTIQPCAHCGTVTHERTNWGGFTGSEFYCVDGVACHARRFEIERQRVAQESEQEKQDDRK